MDSSLHFFLSNTISHLTTVSLTLCLSFYTSIQQCYSFSLFFYMQWNFFMTCFINRSPSCICQLVKYTDILQIFSQTFQECVIWFSDNFQKKQEGWSETCKAFILTCLASVTALLISFLQVIICPERVAASPLSLLDKPADTALKCSCAAAKASAYFSLASCKACSSVSIFFNSFSFDTNIL